VTLAKVKNLVFKHLLEQLSDRFEGWDHVRILDHEISQ